MFDSVIHVSLNECPAEILELLIFSTHFDPWLYRTQSWLINSFNSSNRVIFVLFIIWRLSLRLLWVSWFACFKSCQLFQRKRIYLNWGSLVRYLIYQRRGLWLFVISNGYSDSLLCCERFYFFLWLLALRPLDGLNGWSRSVIN